MWQDNEVWSTDVPEGGNNRDGSEPSNDSSAPVSRQEMPAPSEESSGDGHAGSQVDARTSDSDNNFAVDGEDNKPSRSRRAKDQDKKPNKKPNKKSNSSGIAGWWDPDDEPPQGDPVLYLSPRRRYVKSALRVTKEGEVTIGRKKDSDIVIPKNTVSEFHATIQYDHGKYYLRDEKSTNGTWMDEERLEPECSVEIQRMSKIRFADVRYYALFLEENEDEQEELR